MTPKEKAEELIDKFYNAQIECLNKVGITELEEVEQRIAKQCALIAVDKIISLGLLSNSPIKHNAIADVHKEYWQEVKTEIENL